MCLLLFSDTIDYIWNCGLWQLKKKQGREMADFCEGSTKGRPHYYSTKKEEHASIRFDLSADLSSLFTWNTKQVFVYVTASWNETTPATTGEGSGKTAAAEPNEAVIWDTIITSPSADHLANLGKIAKRKLVESGRGKTVDAGR